MDTHNVVPPHVEASLSSEKGWSPDTWYYMDRPWEHDAQWEKTQKDTQDVIPLIGNVQNRQIYREWGPGCQGWGQGGWGDTDGDGIAFGVIMLQN